MANEMVNQEVLTFVLCDVKKIKKSTKIKKGYKHFVDREKARDVEGSLTHTSNIEVSSFSSNGHFY